MTPEKLFAELLGLGLKWCVTECIFHQDRSQVGWGVVKKTAPASCGPALRLNE